MGHNSYIRDSIIRNTSGAILRVAKGEENNKFYAIIAQCGHVGRGYFIPICFPICAKDMESAIELAKNTARVKRDAKYCILGAAEISSAEFLLIQHANDHDPYLRTDYFDEDFKEIESRRILSEELLEDVVAEREFRTGTEKNEHKVPAISTIKTADMYEEYQVLQRYFAPVKYGDKYIYSKRVNMDELLAAYYQEVAIKNGILKKRASPLSYYYQIFGENNALGLKFDEESCCLVYTSLNGNVVHVPLSETSLEYVSQKVEEEKQIVKPAVADYLSDGSYNYPSAVEKFNRRLQKHLEIKQKKGTQPGDGQN